MRRFGGSSFTGVAAVGRRTSLHALRKDPGHEAHTSALVEALAVAAAVVGGRAPSERPAPPRELLLEARQRSDQPAGLKEPLVENPQQQRPHHRAGLTAGGNDQLLDLVEAEP